MLFLKKMNYQALPRNTTSISIKDPYSETSGQPDRLVLFRPAYFRRQAEKHVGRLVHYLRYTTSAAPPISIERPLLINSPINSAAYYEQPSGRLF